MAKTTYTEKFNLYLTISQKKKLEEKAQKLGYGSRIGRYLRRLVVEGLKQDYPYRDPDNFEENEDLEE